jgi:hypothetical protein
MMQRSFVPRLLVAVIALCGCSTVRVTTDWDPEADFSKFRSFGWLHEQQPATGNFRLDNPLLDARIRAAVDRTLEQRGYVKVADAGADFVVGYHLGLERELDVRTMNTYYGYGRGNRWGAVGYPQTQVREYERGTLVIDIADVDARMLVWRGSGSRRLSNRSSPEKSTQVIDKAVAEILAKFPPR